jgi:hypothetical protein
VDPKQPVPNYDYDQLLNNISKISTSVSKLAKTTIWDKRKKVSYKDKVDRIDTREYFSSNRAKEAGLLIEAKKYTCKSLNPLSAKFF